jgi:hypothetical protein
VRYIFILSAEKDLLDVSTKDSGRHALLEKIIYPLAIDAEQLKGLVPVCFNAEKITENIEILLEQRTQMPPDLPSNYKDWPESHIFEKIEYKGQLYKLCTTGFDSRLIFLMRIDRSLHDKEEKRQPRYLFYARNYKEFDNWYYDPLK